MRKKLHVIKKSALMPLFLAMLAILMMSGMLIHSPTQSVFAASGATISVDLSSNGGSVNPFTWGVNAPDKRVPWAGNQTIIQRLHDAGIKFIRLGPIQYSLYQGLPNTCTAPTTCDFSKMDAVLKSVFDAGAEPLFVVAGYPGSIGQYDWTDYATFMQQVVTRYNVNLVLGKKVRYWEMWNEPTDEEDGTIPDQAVYANFVKTVGGAMKQVDSSIQLVGPAAPWADLGQNGWVDYAAKNTNDLLDILSWHDYGNNNDNDQSRLLTTTRYVDEVNQVKQGSGLLSQSGKRYGAALTEYNIATQDLSSGNNQYFHSAYDAVYAASTIVNATKAKADMFNYFDAAQQGANNLGFLDTNNNFAPFPAYYSFFIFGNHMGSTLLNSTGGSDYVEQVASISQDGKKVFVIAVNKDLQNAQSVSINLNSAIAGSYSAYTLDNDTVPLQGQTGTYQNGQITYTLPPLSVVAFDITM